MFSPIFLKSFFWFMIALLWAIAEIELEGKFGWAEKTQTWYRTTSHHKKSWLLKYITAGKPLNGYHLPIFALTILLSHSHFLMGVPWSPPGELMALALWLAWAPLWDNLWIIFNPHYGLKNSGKKTMWWYSRSIWVFSLFPMENILQWIASTGLAAMASLMTNNFQYATSHLLMMGHFIVFGTLSTVFLVPLYKHYYFVMRNHDDRDSAGIFH